MPAQYWRGLISTLEHHLVEDTMELLNDEEWNKTNGVVHPYVLISRAVDQALVKVYGRFATSRLERFRWEEEMGTKED